MFGMPRRSRKHGEMGKRRLHRLARQRAGEKLQRCRIDESLFHATCGALPDTRDHSDDGFIEVVVWMLYERGLHYSSGA